MTDISLETKILSDITLHSKYARYIPQAKRRETWDEVVDRNMLMHINKFPHLEQDITRVYERSVRPKKLLPSARSLQFAGDAIVANNVRIFNCAYCAVDSLDIFWEASFLLLSGTGLGYSVQKHHIEKLPPLNAPERPTKTKRKRRHLVADSIEGWADAIKVLIKSYFNGTREIDFDYSMVRPKGTRLVTAGGKAPGPEPLRKAVTQVISILENALQERGAGTKLTSLECHDIMCTVADAVRSGGIRRSALICLFDRNDIDMLSCKHGEWWIHHPQRALANNSAVMPYADITKEEFDKVWKAVELSGSGEPGISWTNDKELGFNPCFAAGTMVHTKDGHFPIEDLVGKTVEVHDGEQWVTIDNFRITGKNQKTLNITLYDGTTLSATPYHMFILEDGSKVMAKDLKISDKLMPSTNKCTNGNISVNGAYIKGFLIGDGTSSRGRPLLNVYHTKYMCIDRLIESANEVTSTEKITNVIKDVSFSENVYHNGIKTIRRSSIKGLSIRKKELHSFCTEYKYRLPAEIYNWDMKSKSNFIAGVMDADGCSSSTANGFMYQIVSIHKEWLLDFQLLLKTIGVSSRIAKYKTGVETDFGDGYGKYKTKDAYRMTISQVAAIELSKKVTFERLKSFADRTSRNTYSKSTTIVGITEGDIADSVYCCTVPTNHTFSLSCGIRVGQCHEISLRKMSFCNLVEINGSIIKSQEEFEQVAKDGSFLATLQATYTNFHYLRPEWRDTTEEDALVGVGITGVASQGILNLNPAKAAVKAVEENKRVAALLGINPAKRVTTIKPAGTTSLIFGCSSGIHAWHNDFYIRRMTFGKDEAIAKFLSVFHPELVEESLYDSREVKVSVPQAAPQGAILRTEPVLDTLERVKKFNMEWVRPGHVEGANYNNVSTTISVKDDEWEAVGEWMWENRHSYLGIAVLPYNGGTYQQAPFEDITKEQFEAMRKLLVDISLDSLIEEEDNTDLIGEAACGGGKCEIK